MKKFIAFIGIISMLLVGCSNETVSTETIVVTPTNSLQEKAIELAVRIDMLASDEVYVSTFTVDSEITKIITAIASQEYSNPTNVYKLGGIDNSYKTLMSYIGADVPIFENEQVEAMFKENLITSLPTRLNAMSGVNMIASTSLVTVQDVFLYSDITETEVYLLLYDGDYHVTVLFTPKGEGIVTANANIVAHEMLNQVQVDGDISSSMKLGISFAGISLEKII